MSSRFGQHLRANVVGYVAVFIALCGTAAALPGTNKVDSGDIKKGNVKNSDLGSNAVDGSKVDDGSLSGADLADNSVTGQQVNEATLNLPPTPTSLPPSGAAGGALAGTYPDPTIAPNAVGTDEVDESSLFNDNSLAQNDLGANSVSGSEIATNAIGFLEPVPQPEDAITDGTIDTQDVANNNLTGNDIDESSLGTVPTATSADVLAGTNISPLAASIDSDSGGTIGFSPANLSLSCPSGEANLRLNNVSGVELVSFLDKGAATPEYERFSSLSALETDATVNDLWIWHIAGEVDVFSGIAIVATFVIGIDESDGTDCEFYVRHIANT